MKNRIIILVIPIVIFSILFYFVDVEKVISILKHIDLTLFTITLFLGFPIFVILSEKWRQILKDIGCEISLKEAITIFWGTIPISQFLPLRSGELLKAVYLKRKKNFSLQKGTSSLILDNTIDLTILLSISTISLIFFEIYLPISVYQWIFFMGAIIFILFIISRKVPHDIFHALKVVKIKKVVLLGFYSLLSWGMAFIGDYLLFKSLGIEIPFYSVFAIMPIILLIGFIPITISGLGTREAAIIFFFSKYASTEALLSVGILMVLTQIILPVAIGLIFMKKLVKGIS